MNIKFQAKTCKINTVLKSHIRKKLSTALSAFEDRFQMVIVRLSDINGPRGGDDQRCQVQLILNGMPDIIVEDTQDNMYAAIHKSIKKLKQTFKSKIKRQNLRSKRIQYSPDQLLQQ